MTRRSYNQFCGLAGALDVVGERWTLLIVRDLIAGPKRYSDLAASLDGIGTSLLAARLKQLESDHVIVRRDLPPPAASTVYELTDAGWELADAVVPLAMWGARHGLDENRVPGQGFRPEWSLAVLARSLGSAAGDGDPVTAIEFTIDDESAVVTIDGPRSSVTPGRAVGAVDASVVIDSATLASVVAGRVDLGDALTRGGIEVTGDDAVLGRLASVLSASRAPVD
ncbi:winged helix-turn-helix transcriptional regulator [Gordonia soli]|uniref:Putative HxlR family transcriptional regulator n=1 Tax=Gordonia soli NBRC 108243 TaxID=1223545 RepID=M0QR79_9ACTN|nr:winged helix-turn-helix transcriptional regulator [Gordonia soli]GAC70904.1 putative HxlR family transcriptional regulator [Gordonia soli NBRC 108243]